jgi:hypothetical protein
MAITMLPMTPAMAKTTKTAKTPAQVKILTPKLVKFRSAGTRQKTRPSTACIIR